MGDSVHRSFESELKDLKSKILEMGGVVEKAITEAFDILIQRDSGRLLKVSELEDRINELHIQLDEACMEFLARQSPLAADLRFILALVRINTDLERMGDEAVNVANHSKRCLKYLDLPAFGALPQMAEAVKQMVHDALGAFVREDATSAQEILERDDKIDSFKHQIFRNLLSLTEKDPSTVKPTFDLISIARNLERIGDHATNISEDTIFISTGRDVRHGVENESSQKEVQS